jgi:hypothetical protein
VCWIFHLPSRRVALQALADGVQYGLVHLRVGEVISGYREIAKKNATSGPSDHRAEKSKSCINRMSERETVVELPWAADSCPWVEKLRTVLPLTVGLRDGAVQLVLTHQRVGEVACELKNTRGGAWPRTLGVSGN